VEGAGAPWQKQVLPSTKMLHRREFRAMGSNVLALVDGLDEPSTLADVPGWFEEWEQILSRFRSDSELTQLNTAAGAPIVVSEILWEVYATALEAERATGGLVTPLILEALLYAGYDQSFDLLQPIERRGPQFSPQRNIWESVDRPVRQFDLHDVAADPAGRSIWLPRGALLDFGGVAKGWAAQQAALRLKHCGPTLVSAGGDISVSGPRADGEPWGIEVEDPVNGGAFVETIYLDSGGVATSGQDHRHWLRNGVPQHHIIDPRRGLPAATDVLTATVIARSTVEAEALAKAVLISGSTAGLDWLDSDETLAGLLILENGQRLDSRNLEKYL
jgi:thiamine biosynthesis lipoprotein